MGKKGVRNANKLLSTSPPPRINIEPCHANHFIQLSIRCWRVRWEVKYAFLAFRVRYGEFTFLRFTTNRWCNFFFFLCPARNRKANKARTRATLCGRQQYYSHYNIIAAMNTVVCKRHDITLMILIIVCQSCLSVDLHNPLPPEQRLPSSGTGAFSSSSKSAPVSTN